MVDVKKDFKPFCEQCPYISPDTNTFKTYENDQLIRIYVSCMYKDICSSLVTRLHDHPDIWKLQFPEGK